MQKRGRERGEERSDVACNRNRGGGRTETLRDATEEYREGEVLRKWMRKRKRKRKRKKAYVGRKW